MALMLRALIGAAGAAMLMLAPASAEAQTVRAKSVQKVRVQGRTIDVAAEVGNLPVSSKAGAEDATVGYISYVPVKPAADAERPVLVAFNGGPGASSAFLQMGALGLSRVSVPQDPAAPLGRPAAAPNDDTLLDAADLLFLDPPGTGFSSLAPNADLSFYHSVEGDALANAQAVKQWLASHGRLGAPIYILGESYGTIRATAMIDALAKVDPAIRLRGVLLLGQALNMIETSQRPDNIISYVVSLPSLAAIACYHHKAAAPCTPAGIADKAERFAGAIYLHALFEGRAIAPAEKQRIADQLAALSGIPASYYLTHDLRITKEQFRVRLLKDEGKVVGRYDARYTAPRPADAGETVGPDAFSAVSDLYGKAMPAYLAQLGVKNPADYKVLALPKGEWAYGGSDSPFADWPFMTIIEKRMKKDPDFRLFIGNGLYDLTTTIGAADYLIAQSDVPEGRYVLARYPAGHVSYSDDGSWRKMIGQIRAFLTSAPAR
ncbi:MAG TPA: septum formation initiator [Sphingomonas sp.]|nr:septum formation initiator [Sphingomonas sp.]